MINGKSPFGDFIKKRFVTAKAAAEILGVGVQTIYNNCRRPTGGYKLLGEMWERLQLALDEKAAMEAMYGDLVIRYNKLVEQVNKDKSALEEYLNK